MRIGRVVMGFVHVSPKSCLGKFRWDVRSLFDQHWWSCIAIQRPGCEWYVVENEASVSNELNWRVVPWIRYFLVEAMSKSSKFDDSDVETFFARLALTPLHHSTKKSRLYCSQRSCAGWLWAALCHRNSGVMDWNFHVFHPSLNTLGQVSSAAWNKSDMFHEFQAFLWRFMVLPHDSKLMVWRKGDIQGCSVASLARCVETRWATCDLLAGREEPWEENATPGKVEMKLMWCFSNVNVPGKLKGRDIGSYSSYIEWRNVANLFISYARSHPKKGTLLPGSLRINAIRQFNGTWKEWEGRHRRYFNCFQLSYPTKTKTMTRKIKTDQKALRIFQTYMLTFHLLFPICWLWLWLWIPFRCSNRASRGLMVIAPGSCLGSSCKRRAERLECRCHRQNGIPYQKSWQRCFSTVCLGT